LSPNFTAKSFECEPAQITSVSTAMFPASVEPARRPIASMIEDASPLALGTTQEAIQEAERSLDGNGRVVVRYSGTEALARVMVEGPTLDRVQYFAESIAAAIRSELG
jgi:phosphoglucosamine mutase